MGEQELLSAIAAELYDIRVSAELLQRATSPNWKQATKCHDWRNHVPVAVADQWDDLSIPTRYAFIIMAERQSDAEEWD